MIYKYIDLQYTSSQALFVGKIPPPQKNSQLYRFYSKDCTEYWPY